MSHADNAHRIMQGHALDVLQLLPSGSVQMIATSPPYWMHRTYSGEQEYAWPDGWVGALGQEALPELYVSHLIMILREAGRVLAKDGVLWLQIGDTSYTGANGATDGLLSAGSTLSGKNYGATSWRPAKHDYLKPKDYCMIPAQTAIALQKAGFYLRAEIVWSKINAKPSAVHDRPVQAHEMIYLVSKSASYFYNHRGYQERNMSQEPRSPGVVTLDGEELEPYDAMRDVRTVWNIPITTPDPMISGHTAVWPRQLPLRMILLGCPEDGTVLDPFGGTGSLSVAAKQLGRKSIYIDCSDISCRMAEARLAATTPPMILR